MFDWSMATWKEMRSNVFRGPQEPGLPSRSHKLLDSEALPRTYGCSHRAQSDANLSFRCSSSSNNTRSRTISPNEPTCRKQIWKLLNEIIAHEVNLSRTIWSALTWCHQIRQFLTSETSFPLEQLWRIFETKLAYPSLIFDSSTMNDFMFHWEIKAGKNFSEIKIVQKLVA